MELGLDFEDNDFQEEEKPQIVNSTVYSAKMCEPFWYDNADTTDIDSASNIFKFKGDNLYQQGQFCEAAYQYRQAIDHLPTPSRSLRHDFEESLARCYLRMDKYAEALEIANKLCHGANTVDQQMQGLLLLSNIQSKMADLEGEEDTIKKLIDLHPFNVDFWLKLADIYKSQRKLNNDGAVEYVKVLTCLIRARLLLKCTRRAVRSFVRVRYERLHKNVEQELKELKPEVDWIQKATSFLGEDIFKMDQLKDVESENTTELTTATSDFDGHWFVWAQDLSKT